ncbi:hypothetical protein HOLDEFILI_01333 [Holdemania filiformis DSM 12042]|uniref:Uncharacterized protein n=1 Tax=Holdemania filiformis DSM 12042 TaxID=545696 RepID=B9Y6A1_9FIRM|nr:hypothetical protein HOLDEFILI_01333 [Holdemania filiformis DSM 12042]
MLRLTNFISIRQHYDRSFPQATVGERKKALRCQRGKALIRSS